MMKRRHRRICELQKHTDKRHPSLVDDIKGGDFFSEANGFWLGIFPEGYRKIVKPTEFESPVAIKTRDAVSRWLYKVRNPSRTKDQWEQGWQLGRSSPPIPPPSQKSTERERSQEACYSPTRPSLVEPLNLVSLSLTPAGNLAYLSTHNQDIWYKARMVDNVFEDRRAAENLLRRMKSCLGNTSTIPTEFNTDVRDREILRSVAKELGITEGLIKTVQRQTIMFSAVPCKKRRIEEPEIEIHADGEIDDASDNHNQTSEQEQPPVPSEQQPGQESVKPQEKDRESECTEPEPETRTIRERAEELLYFGVMPLLPPARREWDGVEQIELVGPPYPITWPPVNWQELSGEEKLMAWMSTAMALEYRRGVTMTTSRGQLLDRYAMLALPGTMVEKGEHNSMTALRLLNYNMLKNVYLGRVKEDEANHWLQVLEAARKGADRSAESFGMDKIKTVPLRLTESDISSQ